MLYPNIELMLALEKSSKRWECEFAVRSKLTFEGGSDAPPSILLLPPQWGPDSF